MGWLKGLLSPTEKEKIVSSILLSILTSFQETPEDWTHYNIEWKNAKLGITVASYRTGLYVTLFGQPGFWIHTSFFGISASDNLIFSVKDKIDLLAAQRFVDDMMEMKLLRTEKEFAKIEDANEFVQYVARRYSPTITEDVRSMIAKNEANSNPEYLAILQTAVRNERKKIEEATPKVEFGSK